MFSFFAHLACHHVSLRARKLGTVVPCLLPQFSSGVDLLASFGLGVFEFGTSPLSPSLRAEYWFLLLAWRWQDVFPSPLPYGRGALGVDLPVRPSLLC